MNRREQRSDCLFLGITFVVLFAIVFPLMCCKGSAPSDTGHPSKSSAVDQEAKNCDAQTLLSSVKNGNVQAVSVCVNETVPVDYDLLHNAMESQNPAIVRLLLRGKVKAGAPEAVLLESVAYLRWRDPKVYPPNLDCLQALLKGGTNPNSVNEYGYTPLMIVKGSFRDRLTGDLKDLFTDEDIVQPRDRRVSSRHLQDDADSVIAILRKAGARDYTAGEYAAAYEKEFPESAETPNASPGVKAPEVGTLGVTYQQAVAYMIDLTQFFQVSAGTGDTGEPFKIGIKHDKTAVFEINGDSGNISSMVVFAGTNLDFVAPNHGEPLPDKVAEENAMILSTMMVQAVPDCSTVTGKCQDWLYNWLAGSRQMVSKTIGSVTLTLSYRMPSAFLYDLHGVNSASKKPFYENLHFLGILLEVGSSARLDPVNYLYRSLGDEKQKRLDQQDEGSEEVSFTPDQIKQYYAVYDDPYVKFLRTALNGYLDGSNHGIVHPDSVIPPSDIPQEGSSGLSRFRTYLSGKFIVYSIDDAPGGGKSISIIFQDSPDKVFVAWVYGKYSPADLRGFWQDTRFTKETMATVRTRYRAFLSDPVHSE